MLNSLAVHLFEKIEQTEIYMRKRTLTHNSIGNRVISVFVWSNATRKKYRMIQY